MQLITSLILETIMTIILALAAFGVGCLAATAELLSRYKKIRQILKTIASWVYLLINGIASICAYYLVVKFKIAEGNSIFKVIISGTSALIILRSSVANIKIGDKQTDVGIAAILQVFLNSADRAFDQTRSESELTEVKEAMHGVDFEKAKLALPTTCFTIMKNVSQEEQKRISEEVNNLAKADLDEDTKTLNLGIILTGMTDIRLLKKAVSVLDSSIQKSSSSPTRIQQLQEVLKNFKKQAP